MEAGKGNGAYEVWENKTQMEWSEKASFRR